MKLHKEGWLYCLIASVVYACMIYFGLKYLSTYPIILYPLLVLFGLLWFWFFWFFRMPNRSNITGDNLIMSPCDGKVVVIEETTEGEYFKDKRLQVSIFMSPLNVHVNRYPISGLVQYVKYHAGKYLVAWHPKSSTENERSTIVIKNNKIEILVRQIAGAVARRICIYAKPNDKAIQNEELGFIKFGSRVDLLLPTTVKVKVNLEEKVTGSETVIATFE
jgi:phosphatidylserine decarboxylase